MFTVTFYSYKGGVGRTLALMNTASRLSRKGKRVFVLDFDLEAPGIDVFSPSGTVRGPGIVEYISDYSDAGRVPELSGFVTEMPVKGGGNLFVLPAGRKDAKYQALLAQLNWKQFYRENEGYLFVENLKAAIRAEYEPDYVLVDSRTGLTDISGICTLQLPDLVVLLFGLNNQNLEGTSRIFNAIKHNALNRQVETMLVASPVPDIPEFVGIRRERLERARELLGSEPDLILPFNAFIAFQETTVPSEMGAFLNRAYDQLMDDIVAKNRADITTLLKEARKLQSAGDVELADLKYRGMIEVHPDTPLAWQSYGTFLRLTREYPRALEMFKRARELGAGIRVLGDMAATYLALGDFEQASTHLRSYLRHATNRDNVYSLAELFESRQRLDDAEAAYQRVYTLRENAEEGTDDAVLYDLGNLYLRVGQPARALQYYRQLLDVNPYEMVTNFNYGMALARLGKTEEAKAYFTKAVEMFERRDYPPTLPAMNANRAQAMGQAYSFLGNSQKAIESLNDAVTVAEQVKESPIYSSVQYRSLPPSEFKGETLELLSKMGKANSAQTPT